MFSEGLGFEPDDLLLSSLLEHFNSLIEWREMYWNMGASWNGGTPITGWFLRKNPNQKWMMTGGTPILGTPQILKCDPKPTAQPFREKKRLGSSHRSMLLESTLRSCWCSSLRSEGATANSGALKGSLQSWPLVMPILWDVVPILASEARAQNHVKCMEVSDKS